jgi:P27 family predicted phage terminase small subunit
MRGRKPKPIELRVLHGNAADKALAQYPKPRRVLPRCPEHLDGEAAKCWKRLARELYDAGLLSTIDRDALASYCMAYARWRKAEGMLAPSGEIIVTTKLLDDEGRVIGGGNVVQNPWLAVSNRALDQMTKLAAEFGMTPSSRSRVKAEVSAARQVYRTPRERVRDEPPGGKDPRRALEGTG